MKHNQELQWHLFYIFLALMSLAEQSTTAQTFSREPNGKKKTWNAKCWCKRQLTVTADLTENFVLCGSSMRRRIRIWKRHRGSNSEDYSISNSTEKKIKQRMIQSEREGEIQLSLRGEKGAGREKVVILLLGRVKWNVNFA